MVLAFAWGTVGISHAMQLLRSIDSMWIENCRQINERLLSKTDNNAQQITSESLYEPCLQLLSQKLSATKSDFMLRDRVPNYPDHYYADYARAALMSGISKL